jgi:hypothetical protein
VVAAAAPVVLYFGGDGSKSNYWNTIFVGNVRENWIFYAVSVAVSALLLNHSYNQVATTVRRKLLLSR